MLGRCACGIRARVCGLNPELHCCRCAVRYILGVCVEFAFVVEV